MSISPSVSPDPYAAIRDLEALADGRLALDAFGSWVLPQERTDGTKSWPYVSYTDRFRAAQTALDALIDQKLALNYIAWQQAFTGKLDDPSTISMMDAHDLANQITRLRRGERFSEGFWLRNVESGAMLAALRRAMVLFV